MNLATNKEHRGFVAKGDEINYATLTNDELIDLLKSHVAVERTIGARLLTYRGHKSVEYLLTALETEQKLYPKIEICCSLVLLGKYSINGLIQRLGTIGKNQHHTPADEPFRKTSYPLPRDIAARTLVCIGQVALPALCDVLKEDDPSKMSEAIDAIGFICNKGGQDKYLEPLMACYNTWNNNDLLRWKLVRAMSAFIQSQLFLKEQLLIESNPAIKQEFEKSIRMIGRKILNADSADQPTG